MTRFLPSLAGWSRWRRLLQVVALAAFCVFYWTCYWAVLGLILASLVAGLAMLPVLVSPASFLPIMPWYLNELPLWIVAGGFAAGGVLGFVRNVRIILGEVRRTLFFAEVQEMAERIVEETADEPASSRAFASASSRDKTRQGVLTNDKGFVEGQV